jgi:hypothetical protein
MFFSRRFRRIETQKENPRESAGKSAKSAGKNRLIINYLHIKSLTTQ